VAEGGPGNILIKVGAEVASAVSELGRVNKAVDDTGKSTQSMSSKIQAAAVPAAAAFTAVAGETILATKAAAEHEQAVTKMEGALRRTTGATEEQLHANDEWVASLARATGVSEDQLMPAMSKLALATGSVEGAHKALQVALDVSAQSGKSLEAVTGALAKGYTGNTAALNRLVPGLDQTVIKSKDMNQVMELLAQTTGGAAAEAANTAAGQYQVFQVQMQQLQEGIGTALLPIMEKLVGIMNEVAGVARDHASAFTALIAVVGALSAAILIANAAIKAYEAITIIARAATAAWTAAQWLLNAALDANPIGIVVIAIAALGAALVVAYTRSQTFRNIVAAALGAVESAAHALGAAFNAVMAAASAAWGWIQAHWTAVAFAFGPLGIAIALIGTHFKQLEDIATGVWHTIKAAIDAVYAAISAVIGAVDSLIKALGSIHVPHISIPNPFALEAGGVVLRAPSGLGRAAGPAAGYTLGVAGGTTVNVYGAVDPEGTARAILKVLGAHNRRQGR